MSVFAEQHPPGHWSTNLTNDLRQQAFIIRGKHAEFWVRALDASRKDIEIQTHEVVAQNQINCMAEKWFSALVID